MDRTAELIDIAKSGGMAAIVKNIIDRGATTITEHEFSEALMEHAKLHKRDGESTFSAFARILEDPDNTEFRRAYGVTKGFPDVMSIEPTQVGGNDAMDVNDAGKAAKQLRDLVETQRERAPTLSTSELYSRVYSDPENLPVINRAHRPAGVASIVDV